MLYGSNLGTAEELATRVADLAAVNGFAVKLSTLDDAVGKLPTDGGVIIFSASYNGAPPDNAAQFVKWLQSDLPKDAFAGVRYAVFGCGNRDWAATYQAVPRLIDDELAAHGASRVIERGEGDAREDLGGQFDAWFAKVRALAAQELGADASFSADAGAEPLYRVEPVAPSAAPAPPAAAGAASMKVLVNRELQSGAGTIDPAYRNRPALRRRLSGRRSPQRRPAQRSRARRFRRAALRLPAERSDPALRRRGSAPATAGRRADFGRAPADRIRRAAAAGDAQANPGDGGLDALPRDEAEAARVGRRR